MQLLMSMSLLAWASNASMFDDTTAASSAGVQEGDNAVCVETSAPTGTPGYRELPVGTSMTYNFGTTLNGCYLLEEWHPSTAGCANYLAQSVPLTISYCRQRTLNLRYDQSVNGGQWNRVARLPFNAGYLASTAIQAVTPPACDAGSDCVTVGDAFRLTYLGSLTDCQPQVLIGSTPSVTQTVSAAEPPEISEATVSLIFDSAAGSLEAIAAELNSHSPAIALGIKNHFGYTEVNITNIAGTPTRRLTATGSFVIVVTFVAQGLSPNLEEAAADLDGLQTVFRSAVGQGMLSTQLVVRGLSWSRGAPPPATAPGGDPQDPFLFGPDFSSAKVGNSLTHTLAAIAVVLSVLSFGFM